MTISTDPGKKGPGDKIIKYNDLPISIKEIGEILLLLWENEDMRYPPPQRGSKMSLDFINELYKRRQLTDKLLRKYYLKK